MMSADISLYGSGLGADLKRIWNGVAYVLCLNGKLMIKKRNWAVSNNFFTNCLNYFVVNLAVCDFFFTFASVIWWLPVSDQIHNECKDENVIIYINVIDDVFCMWCFAGIPWVPITNNEVFASSSSWVLRLGGYRYVLL